MPRVTRRRFLNADHHTRPSATAQPDGTRREVAAAPTHPSARRDPSTSHPPDREIGHSQNFLVSRQLVARLVERASISADDLVLEIGPGRGIITEALARRARRLVAVEKDPALAARLQRRFGGSPNVVIQASDFLDTPLPHAPYVVFASIPFNATAEIIGKLLAAPCPPRDAYLVVQAEAAGRFAGRPRESLVSVLLKPWFEPSIVHRFRRADFSPAPRVDVVMLRLQKRGPPLIGQTDARLFRDIVTYAFTAWKPSAVSAIESLVGRPRAREIARDIDLALDAPPSAVRFDQWLALVQAFRVSERHRIGERLAGAERRLRQQQQGLAKSYRTRRTGGAQTRRPPPHRACPSPSRAQGKLWPLQVDGVLRLAVLPSR